MTNVGARYKKKWYFKPTKKLVKNEWPLDDSEDLKPYELCHNCFYPVVCVDHAKYVMTEKCLRDRAVQCGIIINIDNINTEDKAGHFKLENCCFFRKDVKCFNCEAYLSDKNGVYERDFRKEIIRAFKEIPIADRKRKRYVFLGVGGTFVDFCFNGKHKFEERKLEELKKISSPIEEHKNLTDQAIQTEKNE